MHFLNYNDAEYYDFQWHLHSKLSTDEIDSRSSTNCENAWHYLNGFGSQEPVIAIADDGCRIDHPAFDSVNTFRDWAYFKDGIFLSASTDNIKPRNMFSTNDLHGSSCCGIIASHPNSGLTVGVAPNTGLIPIRWEKTSGGILDITESKFLTILDFIEHKVDIFLNTWSRVPTWKWSESTKERINKLSNTGGRREKGILFVWAAGNSNCPIQYYSKMQIPYNAILEFEEELPKWTVLTSSIFENCMVGFPNSIHVAGLASTAQRAHYSCYGTGIDLCAPSNNSHTYNRMTIKGKGITTITGRQNEVTHSFKGTSGSAAIVAGIASLTLSSNPHLTAAELKTALIESASKDLNFNPYPRIPSTFFDLNPTWDVSPVAPFDNPTFDSTGWSAWFGFGKVDAYKAVKHVRT